jgi:hypothetical protein
MIERVLQRRALPLKLSSLVILLRLILCDKVKVKHHDMKTYWEVEVQLHVFLTSVLNGGECSASRRGRFTPDARAPGTQLEALSCLDAVAKRKVFSHCRETNPDRPAHSLVVIPTELSWYYCDDYSYC